MKSSHTSRYKDNMTAYGKPIFADLLCGRQSWWKWLLRRTLRSSIKLQLNFTVKLSRSSSLPFTVCHQLFFDISYILVVIITGSICRRQLTCEARASVLRVTCVVVHFRWSGSEKEASHSWQSKWWVICWSLIVTWCWVWLISRSSCTAHTACSWRWAVCTVVTEQSIKLQEMRPLADSEWLFSAFLSCNRHLQYYTNMSLYSSAPPILTPICLCIVLHWSQTNGQFGVLQWRHSEWTITLWSGHIACSTNERRGLPSTQSVCFTVVLSAALSSVYWQISIVHFI